MRFTVQTLPKLAVSAKLLCLLMVVICGAAPSMVRSVRLYNDCSSSEVRVDMKGRVLADDKLDRFQNMTIRSEDFSMKLTIFGEESKRYLCFSPKWKLMGSKRFRGPRCQFYEEMVPNGYNRYRSVANESHFVGFNKKGRPLRGKQLITPGFEKCFNFLKIDADFSIKEHNLKISGGIGGHRQPMAIYNKHSQFQVRLRHNKNRHKNFIEYNK